MERYPQLRAKRVVLYLGRLHPKKGLDLLVEAWGGVVRRDPEAHLVLAGPDSEGTASRLQQKIASGELASTVTFTGMLAGDMKWSALAAAECFVLPSYSEGLSMSVLEALGCGVPAIITHNCNMPEVASAGAGWEIAADANELGNALKEMLSRAPEENARMGQRGAALIEAKYCPDRVAGQMAELYEFVLNRTEPRSKDLIVG